MSQNYTRPRDRYKKFLEDNGFEANIEYVEVSHLNYKYIMDVVDKSTNEKLIQYDESPDKPSFSPDVYELGSRDGETHLQFWDDKMILTKNDEFLVEQDRTTLKIHDFESGESVEISFTYNQYIELDNLGSIKVEVNKGKETSIVELRQGVFGVNILNTNNKGLQVYSMPASHYNELREEMIKKCLILIANNKIVASNPKIKEKLGVIATFIQEHIDDLINMKYKNSISVIEMLERKKTEINEELEKLYNYERQSGSVYGENISTSKKR